MVEARAFTLIELLVAMAIVGIVVALVAVSARPGERAVLELEATRLAASLALAAREARLTGDTIVWRGSASAYAFARHAEDRYSASQRGTDELKPRTLPSGVAISAVSIGGVRRDGEMRIDFAASTPIELFDVEMRAGDARYSVSSTAMGDVRAIRAEASGAPR
ncbi:MAG TPA: prepilin-type N-terminal cleavage/methylation domain-containing protein [Burkholderiales bacterium]|nr:prepilin-type N-terminal cleavage/methylation domain-containing protein [Burkholderiales bacterium]